MGADGQSTISYADYAIAMVDEFESAAHVGRRISVHARWRLPLGPGGGAFVPGHPRFKRVSVVVPLAKGAWWVIAYPARW